MLAELSFGFGEVLVGEAAAGAIDLEDGGDGGGNEERGRV